MNCERRHERQQQLRPRRRHPNQKQRYPLFSKSLCCCLLSLLFLCSIAHGQQLKQQEQHQREPQHRKQQENRESKSNNKQWHLWLVQRLADLDRTKRQIEESLLNVGLALVNNRNKQKQKQRKLWEEEKEYLVSVSLKNNYDDAEDCRKLAIACIPRHPSNDDTAGSNDAKDKDEQQDEDEQDRDGETLPPTTPTNEKRQEENTFAIEVRPTGEITKLTQNDFRNNDEHHHQQQQQQQQLIWSIPTDLEPFSGMILQVFNNAHRCRINDNNRNDRNHQHHQHHQNDPITKKSLGVDNGISKIRNDNLDNPAGESFHRSTDGELTATRTCLDPEHFSHMYELVEPMHRKLGIAPRHIFDYAYRPVNLIGGGAGNKEGHPGWDETWWDWFLTKSFPPKEDSNNDDDKGNDEADSSSSNEKNNRNANAEKYEQTGERAFAGGSHGEVWRGRRKCYYNARSSMNGDGEANDEDNNITNDDTIGALGFIGKRRRSQQSSSSSTSREKESSRYCDDDSLIMKRLKVEYGYPVLEAGLREVYFGSLLNIEAKGKTLFTVYVDHFFRESSKPFLGDTKELELWIVFEDSGRSLRSFLYMPVNSGAFLIYQHSAFWTKLRMGVAKKKPNSHDDDGTSLVLSFGHIHEKRNSGDSSGDSNQKDHQEWKPNTGSKNKSSTDGGKLLMREVLWQILSSAAFLHDHGIVHRDIKPSNVMCKGSSRDNVIDHSSLKCVLGDFSSAWDHFTSQNLYKNGPSAGEQTDEYAPPEVLLAPTWIPFHEAKPQSYDSWSIGVLALELLLGTPNVFSVDQRTTALLTNKMSKEGASPKEIQKALYLAALSQFCIYIPNENSNNSWPLGDGEPLYNASMTKRSCNLQDFHQALQARDPLGLGFDSSSNRLLHLIWGLLAWDPMERTTASDALQHAYFTRFDDTQGTLTPGEHNAIESQTLDPRMDFNISDSIEEFVCPKCGRKFSDWRSCQKHATIRKHAKFCLYDSSALPTCINAHSMLPSHPTSGYCDIQGRRRTIEDFHAVQLYPDHQFYGIFDGHTGNLASKYAASRFYDQIAHKMSSFDKRVDSDENWKQTVEVKMREAFRDIHETFLEAITFAPVEMMDQSGTTATVLCVTEETVIVASIGDSRAILSSKLQNETDISAIQLTVDHVASNPDEQKMIESHGGFISSSGGIDRVNGILAVTRSIGDANLSPVLSRHPHVVAMTRTEMKELCGPNLEDSDIPCFVVLASDGLWDVMSNQEAVDLVVEVVEKYDTDHGISWDNGGAFQEAAERLTQEAYMRGSTDNIGVCVVAID